MSGLRTNLNANAIALLQQAKGLIDEPNRWTRGFMARDKFGTVVDPRDPAARCFCIIGALHRAAPGCRCSLEGELKKDLPKGGTAHIPFFNDREETQHADVMALFDRTVARLEREG